MGVNLIPVHAIDVNAWYSQDYHLMGNLVTSANCFHLTEGFYLGYMDNTFPNSLYIAVHVLVCLRFSLNARSQSIQFFFVYMHCVRMICHILAYCIFKSV